MQDWMIVERYENWKVDSANSFSFFGLKDRCRKLAEQISIGDRIFCYVSSGHSAFSDIRLVKEATLRPLESQPYNLNLSYYFTTEPLLVLPEKKWPSIKEIKSKLELTRERVEYGPLFQTSIRKLTVHDGELLERKLRERIE